MPSRIYILARQKTPALSYTVEFIFAQWLGLAYELVYDERDLPIDANVISYGEKTSKYFSIPSSGYLEGKDLLNHPQIEFDSWKGEPIFLTGEGDIPFDLFSSVFYLLARVEEYVIEKRDEHGRFEASSSIMGKAPFVGKPIIDIWLMMLMTELKAAFPSLSFRERRFKWLNTFDIDVAYAYKHRPLKRKLGATVKNLMAGESEKVKERRQVLSGKIPDPFDTYNFQKEVIVKGISDNRYFFLLSDGGEYDRNLDPTSPGMQSLIREFSSIAKVGIHPSYRSNTEKELLKNEIGKLVSILGESVTISRQHYLKLDLPTTYRNLLQAGISDDYTMGFADGIGFRAGTCSPFFFFDLKKGLVTDLKVFPLTIMDGTLMSYLKLPKEEAIVQLKRLVDSCYRVGGTFTSLWHNDTIADGENGWQDVYTEMVNYIEAKIAATD